MEIKNNRKIVFLAGFLFSIPVALVSYVNSSFLENYVGIIYIIASFLTILGLLEMPKILTRLGNRLTILIFCSLVALSMLSLAFSDNIYIAISAFIVSFTSLVRSST